MLSSAERLRLTKLFSDTITMLCRSGLPVDLTVRVDALIGVTLSNNEVLLIKVDERFLSNDERTERESGEFGRRVANSEVQLNQLNSNGDGFVMYRSVGIPSEHGTADRTRRNRRKKTLRSCSGSEAKTVTLEGCQWKSRIKKLTGSKLLPPQSAQNSNVSNSPMDELKVVSLFGEEFDTKHVAMKHEAGEDCDGIGNVEDEDAKSLENKEHTADDILGCFDATELLLLNSGSSRRCHLGTKKSWPSAVKRKRKLPPPPPYSSRSTESMTHSCQNIIELDANTPVTNELLDSYAEIPTSSHGDYTNASFGCKVCGVWLRGKRTLRDHIRGTHLALYSYSCKNCGMSFKWRATLKRHRTVCVNGRRADSGVVPTGAAPEMLSEDDDVAYSALVVK